MGTVGRLAPTPSGHLHLGNALAFAAAWLSVRRAGGTLLLRNEDVDRGRARAEVAAAQKEDLRWLGLDWDREVEPQSVRGYSLDGLPTFRCDCSRTARKAGECCCRDADRNEGAWRLRTVRGLVEFVDRALGPQSFEPDEDPIVMRADGEAAYPLAVVVDDVRDGVTEVVRGMDLLEPTATQIRVYESLRRPVPTWLHTPVLLGPDGKKLSKSHGSTELRALREAGWSAGDVWRTLLPLLGMRKGRLEPIAFDPAAVLPGPFTVDAEGRLRDQNE